MVSVIIPLYNGEKYIVRCIESVINQSYKDIEIIIVDDNSADSGKEIIQEYQKHYNNIKYIRNLKTLGASKTRTIGLQNSTSNYILFLDCDDWIDLNSIEKAVQKFELDSEIDIVIWEIKTAFQNNKICSRYQYLYNNVLTNTMALSLLAHTVENEFFLSPLLGCKLFKKELIEKNNIFFPDTIYEDDMFTYLAFVYSRKIALVTGSSLYYYQHSNSLTHHFSERNIIDFFQTFRQLYEYIPSNKLENFYKYLNKSLSAMIDNMIINTRDPILQTKYKTLIFKEFYNCINIEEYYSFSFSITI